MAADARASDCERTASEVVLSTRELNAREGHDAWSSALEATYCEMDLDWREPSRPFAGELVGRQFGDLYVTTVTADPHTVVRTPAMIDSDGRADYLLCVVTDGHVEVRQDGRVTALGDGAFAILDPARPFAFHSSVEFTQVVIRTPRDLLDARIALRMRELVTAQAVSATTGAGRLVSGFLQDVATLTLDPESTAAASLSASTLDMLATSLNESFRCPDPRIALRDRDLRSVQAALVRHIHDPDVSLSEAAHEVGMSLRHVQNLFRGVGTTPSAWVFSVRLERARRLLSETEYTVQEVSTSAGFRDVSHFSRMFRARFGQSPGKYRDG